MAWWRRQHDGRTTERVGALTRAFVTEAGGDDPGRDVAVSGAGLHAALLVLAAGAGPRFAEATERALGAAGPDAAAALAELDGTMRAVAGVEHAVAVWSRATLTDAYRTSLATASFFDGIDRDELDAWTRRHTAGLVDRFPCELRPQTRLAIADAVALVGGWVQPFDEARTTDEPFRRADGTSAPVPFMHATGTSSAWRSGATTVVTLVCAGEEDRPGAHVRLGLGPDDAGPGGVLADVLAPPGRPVEGRIDLALPRFRVHQRHDLAPLLGHLGLDGCFHDDAALAGATPEPLVVDEAAQETVVEVDERGVRAAAVTAFAAQRSAGPPPTIVPVRFDRPFAFAVVDPVSDLALFAGWIADPDGSGGGGAPTGGAAGPGVP